MVNNRADLFLRDQGFVVKCIEQELSPSRVKSLNNQGAFGCYDNEDPRSVYLMRFLFGVDSSLASYVKLHEAGHALSYLTNGDLWIFMKDNGIRVNHWVSPEIMQTVKPMLYREELQADLFAASMAMILDTGFEWLMLHRVRDYIDRVGMFEAVIIAEKALELVKTAGYVPPDYHNLLHWVFSGGKDNVLGKM